MGLLSTILAILVCLQFILVHVDLQNMKVSTQTKSEGEMFEGHLKVPNEMQTNPGEKKPITHSDHLKFVTTLLDDVIKKGTKAINILIKEIDKVTGHSRSKKHHHY